MFTPYAPLGVQVMEPAIDDRDKVQPRAKNVGPAPMSRAPRVLVVEDEQDIAGLIKHALERAATRRSRSCSSGDAALRAVAEQPPDLVILDLNLPVLSGTEVCRILRARPATATCRSSCSRRGPARPIASPGSNSAPTTTSPSRSACASWPRACARCCAGGRA